MKIDREFLQITEMMASHILDDQSIMTERERQIHDQVCALFVLISDEYNERMKKHEQKKRC